jgi:F-type H+-transporting ATPase subunit b
MPRHLFPALALIGLALAIGPAARAQAREEAPADGLLALADPAAPADEPQGDAARAEREGGHDAAEDSNILSLKPPLALATVIVFLLLLLILWRTAWGPLARALDERERHNEGLLRSAETARAESERLLAEHRALMAQAQDQVRGILEEARRDADATANTIVQKAQSEAEAARQRAERDIAQARDQALVEIWTRSADMAVTVAGKVLSREIGPDEQRRLAEVAMSELPAKPEANGHGGGAA